VLPATAAAEVHERKAPQPRYEPGQALVRFNAGAAASERRDIRDDADVTLEQVLALPRTQLVTFDGTVKAAVARLERQPGVAYAQPNFRYHALAAAPADDLFPQQWALGDGAAGVNVLPAWDTTRGAGATIAILDTGVDLTHPDLAPNLWTGPGGVHGKDFVDGDTDPSDQAEHGTHVAGIAAAAANNAAPSSPHYGVAGVAPEAQIMAVRVLDADGFGNTGEIADGIRFAADNGADVINMSLGGGDDADNLMSQAVTYAGTKGAVVIVAAGNDASDNDITPEVPCDLPQANLVCVAALTADGGLADYSNTGTTNVDVGAPGGAADNGGPASDIVSAKPAYGAVFTEDFEGAFPGLWTTGHTSGTVDWSQSTTVSHGGTNSAQDSAGNYANDTDATLTKSAPVSLAGRYGCRVHFFARLATELDFDFLSVSADGLNEIDLSGNSGGAFLPFEFSIADQDGGAATPLLGFTSDLSVTRDGAYVDDLRVVCRAGSAPGDYDDDVIGDPEDFPIPAAAPDGGSFMAIAGTSMATPHVSGVAALVRAADPGASGNQVAQAIREGAIQTPSLAGVTATGGRVDAAGAIQRSLAISNPRPPTQTEPGQQFQPPPQPQPAKPHRPRLLSVRVSRRGVVTMVLRADPNTTGRIRLTANITAARVRTVARRSFRIGSTGRAKVRLKLSRPALRQLKRTHRLRLRARVVSKNAAGLTNTRTGTIRLALRRR